MAIPAHDSAAHDFPPLVQQAMALARSSGFGRSCTEEVGRLLAVLAASRTGGLMGELGTGCGVGAAWLASGLAPSASLVTIELDPVRAEAVRALFAPFPAVRVLTGDWRELLPHGPFDLLFIDVAEAKAGEPERLLDAVKPGGMLLLDDFTPQDRWPEEWKGKPDPVRVSWLNHPRLLATEVGVGQAAAILATLKL